MVILAMKKKVITLIAALAVIAALAGAVAGYSVHYKNNHIVVEDVVYEKNAQSIDLRGTGASSAQYDALREALPETRIPTSTQILR